MDRCRETTMMEWVKECETCEIGVDRKSTMTL